MIFRFFNTETNSFEDVLAIKFKRYGKNGIGIAEVNGKRFSDGDVISRGHKMSEWTGFYDVDRKKIYDNDILEYKGTRFSIEHRPTFILKAGAKQEIPKFTNDVMRLKAKIIPGDRE